MNAKIAQKILIEEIIRIVELSLLDKAEDIAQQAHIHQTRKNTRTPYIIHPKRVQLLARALGYGIDVQVVAILHDVIEDAENKQYYENLIKQKFGNDIYSTIKLLSHDKNVAYNEYLKKLAAAHFKMADRAFKVKMLDMFDNLTDSPSDTQKEKYRNAIQSLIDADLAQNVPDRILKILGIQALTEAPKDVAKPEKVRKKEPEPKNIVEPKDAGPKGEEELPVTEKPVSGDMDDGKDLGPIPDGDGIPGGDIFDKDDPPMGDEGGTDAGADSENSILQFNDKLNTSKIIDKQRVHAEPGFNFDNDNKFYRENYISMTPNGSLLIAVPTSIQNTADRDFIKTAILPKIIKVVYQAMKNGKDVVLIGDYGLPYYDGKYSNSTSGIIAKVLNDKFKNTVTFDTWNPQDYYGFVSNMVVWKELKSRTEAKDIEIKSALYLFLLATNRDGKVASKLKTDGVLETLSKWGLSENDLEMETHNDEIQRIIFPDKYSSPETNASYIIKTYLQLLRVNMLKKVIKYEKEGKVVIVPTDINTSWSLNKSFKNLQTIQQTKKAEKPVEEPKTGKSQRDSKNEVPADKSKKTVEEPEKRTAGKQK